MFPASPSLSGRLGGGGVISQIDQLPNFFHGKIFRTFFHRYMSIWTKCWQIGRMAILAKIQKRHEEKSEMGFATSPHPLPPPFLREEG